MVTIGKVVGETETAGVAVRVGDVVGEPMTPVSLSAIHHSKRAANTTITATVIAVFITANIYIAAVETMKCIC